MTDARVTQGFVLAVATPAVSVQGRVTQAYVEAVTRASVTAKVTQAYVLAIVRGRVADPKVRVWTYTLDGHDYYVVPLGDVETIVYDTYSEQWADWGNADTALWAGKTGINWIDSGAFPSGFGTNVLVGDREVGTLYFLDPEYPFDDDPTTDVDDRVAFTCIAQGQIVTRGSDAVPCFGVSLTGSFGDTYDSSFTDVMLEVSDDAGRTYVDCGTLSITPADYAARVDWRSLGSMTAPGRLFRITDAGAVTRIDGLELFD